MLDNLERGQRLTRPAFMEQGKIARENVKLAKEELREIGFVGTEIDKFQKSAHYMASEFYSKLAEITDGTGGAEAMTSPDSHGKTPLQAEQGTDGKGMAVPTDHAKKDPYSPEEAAAMKKVQDLADIKQMEGPSGEGEGATLSSTNVTNGTETVNTGAKEKMASEKNNKRERILDILLNA